MINNKYYRKLKTFKIKLIVINLQAKMNLINYKSD